MLQQQNNCYLDEMMDRLKESFSELYPARLYQVKLTELKPKSICLILTGKKEDFHQSKKDCFLQMFLSCPNLSKIFFFRLEIYKDEIFSYFRLLKQDQNCHFHFSVYNFGYI